MAFAIASICCNFPYFRINCLTFIHLSLNLLCFEYCHPFSFLLAMDFSPISCQVCSKTYFIEEFFRLAHRFYVSLNFMNRINLLNNITLLTWIFSEYFRQFVLIVNWFSFTPLFMLKVLFQFFLMFFQSSLFLWRVYLIFKLIHLINPLSFILINWFHASDWYFFVNINIFHQQFLIKFNYY